MEDGPGHFCPGCGVEQKRFDRYPWYFCQECLALAEDDTGRRLQFYNAGPMGGFGWCYADAPELRDERATAVICFIRKRRVSVQEARFGGIVAEPTSSLSPPRMSPQVVWLTGGAQTGAAQERLAPVSAKRR